MLNVFGRINKTKLCKINCHHPYDDLSKPRRQNLKKKKKCFNSTSKNGF